MSSKVLRLATRPVGKASLANFTVATETLPALKDGEVRVKNFLLSIDPTLRIWMSDQPQYMPPVEIGAVMRCAGLGVVEESKSEKLPAGTVVAGLVGIQERFNANPQELNPIKPIPGVPLEAWIGHLGLTGGITAYFGFEILKVKAGDTLVVTGAAGSVGCLVGQLGKLAGARVIGIAGGPDKCTKCVEKYKFDACIDYKAGNIGAELDRLCPKGVDSLFENVGGDIMDEVLLRMNNFGRVSVCGLINQYNAVNKVPGPSSFPMILMRRLTVQGFICTDYASRFGEAYEALIPLVSSGKIVYDFHELGGDVEGVVDSINFMLDGKNNGKTIYRLAPNPL